MINKVDFSENLEKSLSKLENAVRENLKNPELRGESLENVVRHSLEKIISEDEVKNEKADLGKKGGSNLAKQTSANSKFLPSYMSYVDDEEAKIVVENLIDLFFKEGLSAAVKESKKYPPFVIDSFRDALVDKIFPEVEKRLKKNDLI